MEMTEQELIVEKWNDVGLLQEVDDPNSRITLAMNLEAMASDMVVKYSIKRRNDISSTMVFPIIVRICKVFGFKKLRGMRRLYQDIGDEWEVFIETEQAKQADKEGDIELAFCKWFVERNGFNYDYE